jgi:hypothetical protein
MSKFSHDARANLSSKKKERHDLVTDHILSMSDVELDSYLQDNLQSAVDTREFLKHLTKIVAALAKK